MAEAFRLQIWNGETDKTKWLDDMIGFPCSADEFKNILEQDGFTGEQLENFVITGYIGCFPEYSNLTDYFNCGEHPIKEDGYVIRENIDELNYLAHYLCELDETERTAFRSALEAGEHNKSVDEIINLACNTEYYNVVPDIYDWGDYGKHVAKEELSINIDYLGDLIDYIDFASYGEEYARRHSGFLLDEVFL